MATYTVQHPGNTALQTEVWTLTLDEAFRACHCLAPIAKGSYWEANLAKPYRRAKRQYLSTLRVYTAGFRSGELSNVLFNCDVPVERIA
jgi:hypothetical protein